MYFALNIASESHKNPNNVGSVIIFRFMETVNAPRNTMPYVKIGEVSLEHKSTSGQFFTVNPLMKSLCVRTVLHK